MSYDPPGLAEPPDAASLIGFESLMPETEERPSLLVRVLLFPLKIVLWPFKLVVRLVAAPFRRST